MTSGLLDRLSSGPIDFHAHVTADSYPADPDPSGGGWPCLACRPDGRRVLEFGGKPFRKLDARSWDVARRIEDMERDGVAGQILSPMPELFSYRFSAQRSAALCDHINGFTASLVARAPARFGGLGIVSMQDVPTAVRQIAALRARFGLIGIEIGSNINGLYAGDPAFDPVFEAAAAAGLIVFVHAFHPLSAGQGGMLPAWTPFAGFPADIGQAAASCILRDLPGRFPGLKMLFSHGGGVLGAMLGRLDRGFEATGGYGGTVARSPGEVARDMFYDSNVYDPHYLRHMLDGFGANGTVLGTDYPYDIMQADPLGYLRTGSVHGEAALIAASRRLLA